MNISAITEIAALVSILFHVGFVLRRPLDRIFAAAHRTAKG